MALKDSKLSFGSGILSFCRRVEAKEEQPPSPAAAQLSSPTAVRRSLLLVEGIAWWILRSGEPSPRHLAFSDSTVWKTSGWILLTWVPSSRHRVFSTRRRSFLRPCLRMQCWGTARRMLRTGVPSLAATVSWQRPIFWKSFSATAFVHVEQHAPIPHPSVPAAWTAHPEDLPSTRLHLSAPTFSTIGIATFAATWCLRHSPGCDVVQLQL